VSIPVTFWREAVDSELAKLISIKDAAGQILKSFDLQDRDKAFDYANELEEMGIEVTLNEPSLPETLIMSLGASTKEREDLMTELNEEIDDHVPTCCSAAE